MNGVIDLQMFGMAALPSGGIGEIDRQAPLANRVVDAANAEKEGVLRGAHDFKVKVAVLFDQRLPRCQPLL